MENSFLLKNEPLLNPSLLKSDITTVKDIWISESLDCISLRLIDWRNCITKLSEIEQAIPKDFL